MDWTWYLFRFEGRINRAKLWLGMLIIVCWMLFLALLIVTAGSLFGGPTSFYFGIDDIFGVVDPESYRSLTWANLVSVLVHALGTPLFLWVYLATSVKRLHDRDKSGWWMVPFFVVPGLISQFTDRLGDLIPAALLCAIASILCIWGFVEMYCLRGSPRTNQFGADPLPKAQTRSRSSQSGLRTSSGWDQHSEIEFVPHIAGPSPAPHDMRGHE
jgi:uncharacterized membrane protein YhaH (DUF805 family)